MRNFSYSGTVAAAREGAMQKKKAIAISIWENGTEVDYAIAAEVAVMIIQRLLAEEWVDGTYWNVNIPHSCLELPKEEIPVVVKPLGQRRYMSNVEERNDPRGGTYFWLGGNPIPTEEDNSDAFWCEQGAIVITPLHLDCTYRSSTLLADEAMTMSDFISNDADEDANDSSRMELVHISAGTFMMGALSNDDKASSDERPRHKVEISRDFYVGKYPVTQELWEAVMGNNSSHFKGENRPVEKVSWFDCVEFCNKLSQLENKELAYTINGDDVSCNWTSKGYRLLTEAEWEYCARGGEYHLYAGSDNVDKVAWYRVNSGGKTHPVGQKKPNGFGLYDMSGNVFEWCWDWFDRKVYQSRPVTGGKLTSDPRGPTSSSYRVFRGGYWSNDSDSMQASFRSYYSPTARSSSIGFRLVLPL